MTRRTGIYVWVVLLTATLSVGLACAKAPNDGQISSQVQEKFNGDSGLQGKAITVQSSEGVVTLSGTVDNDGQRTAAARYAASVPGTKQIINNLQVAPAAAMTPLADQQQIETPAPSQEPVRKASKPRASTPRHRPSADSETASAAPTMSAAPMQHSEASSAPSTPPPPPAPKKVTIPSGTTMAIRLVDAIDSETAQQGQSFKATLDSPLSVEGDVVIPSGYDVQGHIVEVKSAGKFAGQSELVLQLDRISVSGKSYSIQTDQYRRQGSSRGKNTAAKVGTGAAIGAIIGGIAGGGKGAAIGAAAGGGLGGGVQAATKGQQIKLPTETVLNFTLQSALTVTPAEGPNSNRPKLEPPQQ